MIYFFDIILIKFGSRDAIYREVYGSLHLGLKDISWPFRFLGGLMDKAVSYIRVSTNGQESEGQRDVRK